MRLLLSCLFFLTVFFLRAQNSLPGTYEASAQYQRAMDLFRLGQYEAASSAFQLFIASKTNTSQQNFVADYEAEAVYLKSLCAWHLDRPDAEAQLRSFLSSYPAHVSAPMARVWLARNTFRNKQYRETLQEIAPLSIPDAWLPDSVNQELRYMAGICWYQYRDYAKSLKYFSDLMQYEGQWKLEAIRYTGVIQYETSDFSGAIQTLNGLGISSHTAETVLALARSYYESGQLDALLNLTQQLPDNLKDPEIYLILAATSLRQEKYAAALEWFDRYQLQRNLNYPTLKYQYAYAAFRENRYALAKPIFEQLITQADSLSSLSSYYLAFCFLKEGKTESARLAFMRAASERVPSSISEDAMMEYAKISYQEKYLQDAVTQLKSYLKKYPSGRFVSEAKALIGEVLFYSNNYKESVAFLESAKTNDDRSLSAYQQSCYYYGLELYRKKAYKEADIYFRKGFNLTQEPGITAACRYWYAESQFRQGNYSESLRQYTELIQRPAAADVFQAEAWYGRAWANLMQENTVEAAEGFNRYLSMADKRKSPDLYQDALLRAGDCEFYLKNYREALKHFQEAQQTGLAYPDYAIFQSGRIQYRLEKYTEAAALFKKVIQNHRESDFRDDALDQVAETYLKWLLDYKSASQYSRQLIQEHPLSEFVPAAWNRMGIAAYNSNDKPAAEKYFRKVLTDYCQDTSMAVSALNNISFIVSSDQFADVMSQYRKACPEINPALEGVAWEAASDKYEASAWKDAIPLLSLYLREYPGTPRRTDALYFRAVCYDKIGEKDKALPDLEELSLSKIVHEKMGPAWKMMGEIYTRQKQWLKAGPAFQKAREFALSSSEKWEAGMLEVQARIELSEMKSALEVIESINLLPGLSLDQRFTLQLKKAGIYLAQNDTSLAKGEYSALVQEARESAIGAEAGYQIVRMQANSGNIEAAEESALQLKDAYSAYPEWVVKAYMVMIDAYIKAGDDFQAGSLIEYILSQPEEYFPGMKEEALEKQKKLTPTPANQVSPEPGKKKSK